MAIYKKPLYDKAGNQIYPDVGLELDEVIYGDDPGQVDTPSPWIETGDIKNNQITSAKVADGAITSEKIGWATVGTSVALTSLGTPACLTNISNHSYIVGGKFLVVNFVANLTTSSSSYTRAGQLDIPSNIGYEAPISAELEGGTIRYAYLESSGKFVIATSAAASSLKIRVNGVVVLS